MRETALITGGAKRIGKEIALLLSILGYNVALHYNSSKSEAEKTAERFVEFAKREGFSPVSLAIAWAASHPAVTAPLLGARNIQQLDECLKALDIIMTPELRLSIASLSKTPPLATDRNDELQMAHL